jgi:DNA-binding winged helix-turn-helix (wHTH) protein
MEASLNGRRTARFGLFEADLTAQKLWKQGSVVRLQEKPFQLLSVLLERAGEVVTRDELRMRLWPADTFVEFDDGVNAAVGKLRHALRDSTDAPVFIETLRGKGYRWIAPVEVIGNTCDENQICPSSTSTQR